MSRAGQSLDIEVTRRCNLRCDYCFVGWSRDWTTDLPEEVARAVIDEGADLFPMLHFTGGEPFAYRALPELIERGLAAGYESVLVNTNGTFLSEKTVRTLASFGERFALTVSLDGPQEIHDRARGAGRFREADEGLRRALEAGVRASVMVVVTPEVLRELAPFVIALARRHPRLEGITLFPVGVGPQGSQKPGSLLRSLTPDEVRKMVLAVALLYRCGIRIGISAYPIVNPMLRALGYPEEQLYQCTAGRGRACVHADQAVSVCHPVKDPVYGRWRPGMLRELHRTEEHARLAARDFEGCSECGHREACGHCRAFVTASGAPLFGNDGACQELLPAAERPAVAPLRRKLHVLSS
jgi:radical SAM protein with 4Fe4S-binding SPASM domain